MEQGTRYAAKSLRLLDAIMVDIGAMIGAGMPVLTGMAAEITGPAALLVCALTGGVTTVTAPVRWVSIDGDGRPTAADM